jgi:hypothetical protein
MAALLSLLPVSTLFAAPPGWVSDAGLRGLKLDLEACVNNGCLSARDAIGDDAVYLATGQAAPVRIRLHLDCALPADVRGISKLARIILVPAGTRTLECPLEPIDAYCSFLFWEGDSRSRDAIVDSFVAIPPDTPWPAAEDRVDEAEFILDASPWIPAGAYDLVAALPQELVDEYPCEELRLHHWVETPSLRIVITERPETVEWVTTVKAMTDAGLRGDPIAVRSAFDRLREIAHAAPEALPSPGALQEAVALACRWVVGEGCEGRAPPPDLARDEPDGPPIAIDDWSGDILLPLGNVEVTIPPELDVGDGIEP